MSSFHGKVSHLYLDKAAEIFLPIKQCSYEKMKLSQGDNVVDVGCGAGIDIIALAGHVGAFGNVTGFDHDVNMLEQAAIKIENTPLDKVVRLIQGSATEMPFQTDYFDSCRSERLFMHLIDPDQVLSEMVRVTKPGGRIVIVDTDWSSLSIDNPLPKIEHALSNYRITRVANNGYSGRSLYRQFRQQQLLDINVEAFPICLTDIELFYFISMQQAIEDQALADHVVTEQELEYWRKELHQAASSGCFYGSATVVMVSATKPLT